MSYDDYDTQLQAEDLMEHSSYANGDYDVPRRQHRPQPALDMSDRDAYIISPQGQSDPFYAAQF